MKKHVIAMLLAFVIASNSIGTVPVIAAETTTQESVTVEEDAVEESEQESTEVTEESDTANETEMTEDVQEDDSADIADTSIETAEVEEPVVVAEGTTTESEGEEAKLAGEGDIVDSGTCGENATWILTGADDNLTLTISGSGKMKNYSIRPGDNNFAPWNGYISRIKTLIIENDITYIGSYAFYFCKNLSSVSIPESLTGKGWGCFLYCYDLYDDNNMIIINNVLFECFGTSEIVYIPDGITRIGDYAFWNNYKVHEVVLPDGVISIGIEAFEYCRNLEKISFPDTLIEIGREAFYGCESLKTVINIPKNMTVIGPHAFKNSAITGINIPDGVVEIGECAFTNCIGLENIVIPEGVTTIGSSAFSSCHNLVSVSLPSTVSSMGTFTFSSCSKLENIVLPDALNRIEASTFNECYGLKSITIPSGVTHIGNDLCSYCSDLKIYFTGPAPIFGSSVFRSASVTVYYPMNDSTWNSSVFRDYDGNVTWVPWDPTEQPGDDKDLKIVSTTPENGDLNVDHALDYYCIQFDENIAYANAGYAYLYDTADESNPVAKAFIGDTEDTNTESQSVITGKNTLELRFPISVEVGHEYYIKIDADCIKKDTSDIVGGEEDLEEVYFKGITDDQSWRFKTCAVDYMHFNNPTDRIHESVYHILFNPIYASWIRMKDDGTDGTCFGWAYTVGAKANGYDGINGFNDSLKNLEKDSLYGATDFSFLEYIQYAHLCQYTSEKTDEKLRKNKYDDLFNAIKASINGTGPKIIINIWGKGGHAVYPLSILEENDSEVQIQVINPNENFVTGSHLSILTLKKKNGSFNGFEMEDYDKSISYCTIDVTADWAFSVVSPYMSDNNMVHSSVPVNNSDYHELEHCGDDDVNEDGLHLYWYDGTQVNISLGSDNQIGITDGYKDISVTAGDDADISLDLDEMTSTVECLSDTPSEYEISYSEATSADDINTITVTSTTSESIVSQKTTDGLVIQSSGSEDIFIQTDELTIKAPTHGDDVLITTNDDNGVEVLKDSDNDGTYDEQIEVEILNGDKKQITESMLSNIENKVYTGEEIEQDPIVMDGDKELVLNTDYTLSYENNINAGTAKVIITGNGDYTGTIESTFLIEPQSITPVISLTEYSFTYTGASINPQVTVSLNGEQLIEDVDYTLSYENNIEPGTAMVIVTCIGNYSGSATKEFTINKVLTGLWKKDRTGWWYLWEDGTYPKNKFEIIEGVTYYFNPSGYMVTGWRSIDGKWYYFNASGAMMTGWQKLGGVWYYMDSNGAMVTGWQSIGGVWYYFNSSGAMQTGWRQLGGVWYYMNSSGAMVTGWQSIGGKWYYFNASGAMMTGWQQIGDVWYYMNSSGAMVTGWLKLGNTWYYMNASGAMVTGRQQIDGTWYTFSSSGAMQ